MKTSEEKQKAYELIVLKGYNQKDVAGILGVSENTISKWSKRHEWKAKRTKLIYSEAGTVDIITDICKIKDKALRDRLIDKILKMTVPE